MLKRIRYMIILFVSCLGLSIPCYAEDTQSEREYRIYLDGFAGNVDRKIWREQRVLSAGWGSRLIFALEERPIDSETTGYLINGATPVKGASWEAVLSDGTIVTPFDTYVEVDRVHAFDDEEEQKKWEQEYA